MSSDSEVTSSPEEGSYSPGSSVSTGLREEYEELLQYAVVTPKFDGKVVSNDDTVTRTTHLSQTIPHEVTNTISQATIEESTPDDQPTSEQSSSVVSSHGLEEEGDDVETARLSRQLDGWYRELKSNVLAEFGLARARLSNQYNKKLEEQTIRYQSRIQQLEDELGRTQELLVTYEQSVNRKDHIVTNLTRALRGQKNKCALQQSFGVWKLKMCNERREVFTSMLARQMRRRQMMQHTWVAWKSVIENKWKERIEKACQARAQEVCIKLTNDYEERLEKLQQSLNSSQQQVKQLQVERVSFEEGMKKAFMRGVCALNMEAMNMFHPGMEPSPSPTGSHEPQQQASDTPTPVDNVPPPPLDRGRVNNNTMTRTCCMNSNRPHKSRPSVMVERHTTLD